MFILEQINHNDLYHLSNGVNQQLIKECARRLIAGEIAIIPTDGVYAVAGDFMNPIALKKLAEIKKETVKKLNFHFSSPTLVKCLNIHKV